MWGSYLSSVCRVCLNENAKNPTKFESVVFFNGPDDDSKNYLSVRECFRDCTTIEVNECDVQDTFLCSICLSRLQEAYQFQMDSRAANENFNENSARFQKFKIKDYINLSTSVTFDNPVELETNGELPQKLIQDPLVAISSKLISTTKRMEIESASNLSNDFLMTDQENDPFIKQEDIISACNRESNQESSSSSSSNSSRSRKYQKLSKEPFKNSKIVKSLEELSCENCNKKFTYKNALKYHVKHLPCLKTKFKYDEAIDKLIRKKKESIPQSSEVFDEISQTIKSSCPECPRLFATPSTYKIHFTYQHLKIEGIEVLTNNL